MRSATDKVAKVRKIIELTSKEREIREYERTPGCGCDMVGIIY